MRASFFFSMVGLLLNAYDHFTREPHESEPAKCNRCNRVLISDAGGGLMLRNALLASLFLHILLLSSVGIAQDYPTKPITMVVPFPPGGVAELVGRPLAAAMQPIL